MGIFPSLYVERFCGCQTNIRFLLAAPWGHSKRFIGRVHVCRHADAPLNPVLHLHLNGRNSALGLLCNDHFQVGDLDGLAQRAFLLFLPILIRFVDAEA